MKQEFKLMLKWFSYLTITFLIFGLTINFDFIGAIVSLVILWYIFRYLFFKDTFKHPPIFFNWFRKKHQDDIPPLTKEKMEFYEDSGLSPEEIDFFRNQLKTARNHLFSIETEINKQTKLQAINTRYNLLPLLKAYFSEIKLSPHRLGEVGDFLYTFLPSLEELTCKYNEISKHATKTQLTYQILNKTAEAIEILCKQIEADYLAFQKDDFDNVEIEIEHIHQNLSKKDNNYSSTENNETWEENINE